MSFFPSHIVYFLLHYLCIHEVKGMLHALYDLKILWAFRQSFSALVFAVPLFRCWRKIRWPSRWTPWSTTGCPTPPSPSPTWRTRITRPGMNVLLVLVLCMDVVRTTKTTNAVGRSEEPLMTTGLKRPTKRRNAWQIRYNRKACSINSDFWLFRGVAKGEEA